MKLTGKCKEDFEKWLDVNHFITVGIIEIKVYHDDVFLLLPPSMQYGVYVDFFDSVGIVVSVNSAFGYAGRQIFRIYVGINRHQSKLDNPLTRQEARTKAIEKANEIYNQTK